MKKKYYLQKKMKRLGPFNIKELKEMKISKNDEIWYEGLYNWTETKNIVALQSLFREDKTTSVWLKFPILKLIFRFFRKDNKN